MTMPHMEQRRVCPRLGPFTPRAVRVCSNERCGVRVLACLSPISKLHILPASSHIRHLTMSTFDDSMDRGSDSDSDYSPSPFQQDAVERTTSGSSRFSGLNSFFHNDGIGISFGGSSKRRGGASGGARDAKSRRREEFGMGTGRRGGQPSAFHFEQRESGGSMRQKDELVDPQQVETLRART